MKKKIISLIVVIIMVVMQFSTIVYALNDTEFEESLEKKTEDTEYNGEIDNVELSQDIETVENENSDSEQKNEIEESDLNKDNYESQNEKEIESDYNQITEQEENDSNNIIEETKEEMIEENHENNQLSEDENKLTTLNVQATKTVINEEFSVSVVVDNNKVNSYVKDGIYYLFIPKSATLANLKIDYTGNIDSMQYANFNAETKKITGNFVNESKIIIKMVDGTEKNVIIMQSDVPAVFVNLDNNVTLKDVNDGSKEIKYSGLVNVTGCDNSINNFSQTIEFKGRGNTSWSLPKKGYQIKLDKKTNFMGIGKAKAKKWILIPNYLDPTLLKNKIINDLCVNTGLSKIPSSNYADLYVNGNYVGNYLVCDKVEINESRVNLKDKKGVLIELDNAYYNEEKYNFVSQKGIHYTVKESVTEDNETMINEAMQSFKLALDAFEDEIYSDNPSWDKITQMIDVDSFAKYYLINEFAQNTDSYYSSCYLYKDGDNDVIHMGPTWDYDQSFGLNPFVSNPKDDFTLYKSYISDMRLLYRLPQFAVRVNEIYISELKPVLDNLDIEEMSNSIEKSSKINTIVWSNMSVYNKEIDRLNTYVKKRKEYYSKRYSNIQVEYSTHIEGKGWNICVGNGVSGTEGKSLRLEGLRVKAGNGYGRNISVIYRTHVQDIGWQDWVSDGELAGTIGQSLRVEAVQLQLNNSPQYSIRYRVHIQDLGWSDWAYDGEIAGTEGRSLRIEAIEIQIVEKNGIYYGKDIKNTNALISYKGHIQNIGDTGYSSDGGIIGTEGYSLRLEGLKIELGSSLPSDIQVQIDEHIQDIGWKYGLTNNQYIGTQGQGLRLEALSFRLTGSSAKNYSIRYRVHVQDIGWQEWKLDGQIAGTVGQFKRIEAIQIEIVKK